jgi:biopolymer transport protein ExbB/TolQ
LSVLHEVKKRYEAVKTIVAQRRLDEVLKLNWMFNMLERFTRIFERYVDAQEAARKKAVEKTEAAETEMRRDMETLLRRERSRTDALVARKVKELEEELNKLKAVSRTN